MKPDCRLGCTPSPTSSVSSGAPRFVWRFDREPPVFFLGFFRALIARHTVYYNGVSVLTKEVSRCVEKNKDIVLRTHQICSWSGSFVRLSAVLKPVLKDRGAFWLFWRFFFIIYFLAFVISPFLGGLLDYFFYFF